MLLLGTMEKEQPISKYPRIRLFCRHEEYYKPSATAVTFTKIDTGYLPVFCISEMQTLHFKTTLCKYLIIHYFYLIAKFQMHRRDDSHDYNLEV
jgi:hypothetical protein